MQRPYLLLPLAALAVTALSQPYDSSFFGGLKYRLIGPFRGGRALAVTGVPGNADKFYFGAVGGGVWESDNAGRTWFPIFDKVSVASIGAVAVAPSDPSVIYVGTGEADMRNDIQQGDGMYRSADSGKSWTHIGLTDTRQIGKILVDPSSPDTVYVAALGHQYGPNEQRGVFKSEDGGKSWTKVLGKGPNVGAIDLAMDPTDSNKLFATLWATRRPPWSVYPPSNGPGGGLFKSTDAGKTWTQITGHGFPAFVGKVGISICPSDHNRIYALADTNDVKTGGAYRSDDGGETWTRTDSETRIWFRGWYFARVTADPKNPDVVYVMNTSTYRSTDGGKTFIPIKGAPGGDDYHELWIEPDDPNRMILSSDQGVVVSVDGAKSWSSWYNQPTAQFYHVITDNRFPYWVYGAQQDSGAMGGPSQTIHTGISGLDWRPMEVGGESDTIAPDPLHPGLLYGSTGNRERLDIGWVQDLDPTLSRPDTVWRSEWTHPIAGSPTDPHVFYISHQKVFRTANGGKTWKVISPDLTRKTVGNLPNLDQATRADHTGLSRRGVVYWIAPSPIKSHQIWAGTDDGYLWLTRDEGAHWKNVTPPALTPWSKIGIVDASHFDSETAYAAIDRHRIDDNHPYIYRTHDGGKHWALTVHGIPSGQFVNVVREDPERKGLLYAGTDWGVYVSFDDGAHWQPMQLNLPAASVRDIAFRNGDLVVGTHGRSIWILDNPAILRQLSGTVAQSGAYLFKPATACIVHRAGSGAGPYDEGTPLPPEEPQGQNPAWGAIFEYYVAKPDTPVVISVTDQYGKLIRRMSSADRVPPVDYKRMKIPAYWVHPEGPPSGTPGAHRYAWNLRYRSDRGPVLPPGNFLVHMTVNGKTYTQPLHIVKDPRVPASEADLRSQFDMAIDVEDEETVVRDAQKRADKLMQARGGKMTPAQLAKLESIIGGQPATTPDENEYDAQDPGSLRAIAAGLGGVSQAVGTGPAAPTPEDRRAFAILKRQAAADIAALKRLGG